MSTLWMNSRHDVSKMLDRINDWCEGEPSTLAVVENVTGKLRDGIIAGSIQPNEIRWNEFFLSTGSRVIELIGRDVFDQEAFITMLLDKHRRYGTKSLSAWRELGILTRIDQKIARWVNMRSSNIEDHGDESLYDTQVDIIGYCVIGLYMAEKLPKL